MLYSKKDERMRAHMFVERVRMVTMESLDHFTEVDEG